MDMRSIIIADANADDRRTAEALLSGRYETRSCASAAEAASMADEREPDLLIIDEDCCGTDDPRGPPNSGGASRRYPAVIYSARGDRPAADPRRVSSAPRLDKPYRAEALLSAIRAAMAGMGSGTGADAVAERPARRDGPTARASADRRLLGDCAALREVAARIALYAMNDAPVLILGESGTGKELAAAAIHRASGRRLKRFLPVDCAAIPETLAESILFGTVKGAYTDARETKGAFESACGGTLFLDEIGELSLSTQAKFLRTLETSAGSRVGSIDTVAYDVRILSATNATLSGDRRRFRPELMHRIDTLVLTMPALRDHKGDIPALADSFLSEFSPGKRLSASALSKLMRWDWPGNVRELRNVVRRAGVLSGERDDITPADVEFDGAAKGWQASLF